MIAPTWKYGLKQEYFDFIRVQPGPHPNEHSTSSCMHKSGTDVEEQVLSFHIGLTSSQISTAIIKFNPSWAKKRSFVGTSP